MNFKWLKYAFFVLLLLFTNRNCYSQLFSDLYEKQKEFDKNKITFDLHKSMKMQLDYDLLKDIMEDTASKQLKQEYKKVYDSKNFFNLFQVDCETAFMYKEKNDNNLMSDKYISIYPHYKITDSLISGKDVAIYFYKRNDDRKPSAYFQGDFSKGYADGYGFLLRRDPESGRFVIKRGFWGKGKFLHEKESEDVADYYANTFDYLSAFGEGEVSNIRSNLSSVNYNWDRLYPEKYTNGRYFLDKVTFDFNGKPEWMIISISFPDYYSNADISFHTASNNITVLYKTQIGKKIRGLISSLGADVIKTVMSTGGTKIDEHTAVAKGPWNSYGYTRCRGYDEAALYEDPYVNSGDRVVHVYTRKQKTDEWKALPNEWTIIKSANCDRTKYFTDTKKGSEGGVLFRRAFSSEDEAVRDIVNEARSIEPYEINDPKSNSSVLNLEIKRELMMKRITNIETLQFNSEDTIIGAWFSETRNKVYLIYPGYREKGQNIVFVPLDDNSLGNKLGYVVSATNVNWYKTDKYNGYCLGRWENHYGNLSFTCNNSYDIKELKKDQIVFEQGDVWNRIK